MRSLRSRLTLFLVSATLAVVVLAALVAVQVLERPDRSLFAAAFAEEVRILSQVLSEDPDAARRLGVPVAGPPVEIGDTRFRDARSISRILAEAGVALPVRVVGDEAARTRQLAFEFAPGRWAYLPYPGYPPRNWPALAFYLGLVVAGSLAVSLLAATKMTRPLRILEEAVRAVGPDGLPATLPEEGPAEMRATAAALNRLTGRVRAAVESRMRLVAAAGHDLRTPMTRMRLRAEFLPEEDREVWLKDLAELDHIADSAIRLVREEVEPGSSETVSLNALLVEIADELGEIGRPVETGPLAPLSVAARPLALKRALRNLMENAAVHGGQARVALAADGGAALVTILDEGPGIPEALMARVFEPFFRVDPARRRLSPGAGLGLAIAKEILDHAGGTLTLRNRRDGGLEQIVRLPLGDRADA